jgi:ankyrin repeat protein
MIASGTPVDQRDGFGATPLLFATISGKREIFDYLLSKKADPKIIASEGYTLMHAAALAKDKALISRLLDLGLDVNARHGDEGITPVDIAHEDPEAVELLRLHGGKSSWELGRR